MRQQLIIDWLRAALKKSGKTQEEAASAAGLRRDALNKALNGKRDLSASEMLAVSSALGVPLPGTQPYLAPTSMLPSIAPVLGIIAPGSWREAGALMKTDYSVPVVPEPRYAQMHQYALRYEGPPHSLGFIYGDFLIFVPLTPNASNVEDGSIVDFRRYRDGTSETTIRIVHILPDHTYELKGETGDMVIPVQDLRSVDHMEVKGVYVGLYRPRAS